MTSIYYEICLPNATQPIVSRSSFSISFVFLFVLSFVEFDILRVTQLAQVGVISQSY